MIGKHRIVRYLFVASFTLQFCTACAPEQEAAHDWLLGTWDKTYDEDDHPPDSITFRKGGTYATYDDQCKAHFNSYFVREGLVFLMVPLPKGPVALVLEPNRERSMMSFTSPRTRNNARYEPSDGPHCRKPKRLR